MRELVVKAFQELEELLMAMARIALPDHFSLREFKGGK